MRTRGARVRTAPADPPPLLRTPSRAAPDGLLKKRRRRPSRKSLDAASAPLPEPRSTRSRTEPAPARSRKRTRAQMRAAETPDEQRASVRMGQAESGGYVSVSKSTAPDLTAGFPSPAPPPDLKLWNDATRMLEAEMTCLSELFGRLERNHDLSLYIGQDKKGFPDCLADKLLASGELNGWRDEILKPGLARRVMIFDPSTSSILPLLSSPKPYELEGFIDAAIRGKSPRRRQRVFGAQYTSFLGLSNEMQLDLLLDSFSCNVSQERPADATPTLDSHDEKDKAEEGPPLERLRSSSRYSLRDKIRPSRLARWSNDTETNDSTPGMSRKKMKLMLLSETRALAAPSLQLGDSISMEQGDVDSLTVNTNPVLADVFGPGSATSDDGESQPLKGLSTQAIADPLRADDDQATRSFDFDAMLPRTEMHTSTATVRAFCRSESPDSSECTMQRHFDGLREVSPMRPTDEPGAFEEEETLDGGGVILKPRPTPPVAVAVPEKSICGEQGLGTQALGSPQVPNSRPSHGKSVQNDTRSGSQPTPSRVKSTPSRPRKGKERMRRQATPKGDVDQAIEGKPCSGYVYLWNCAEKSRSNTLVLLETAIEHCLRSPSFMLYDGQDYDFENGIHASRVDMFNRDRVKWATREENSYYGSRKVRLWCENFSVLRCYQYSPLLHNLPGWLVKNLDFSVFQPSVLDPTCSPLPQGSTMTENERKRSKSPRFLIEFVRERLLPRIRQTCITEVNTESLLDVEFWNKRKQCREARNPFKSRSAVTMFLFTNPWIEIYRGQEALFEFGRQSGLHLIPILTNCPAEIASFWDKKARTKYLQPKGDPDFLGRTIFECLSRNENLELYLGQDTELFKCVCSAVERYGMSGSFPYRYMLAYCGSAVQKFLTLGNWSALHLDISRYNTASAVFWKKEENSIVMQPMMSSFISIQAYLEDQSERTELYVGQDIGTDDFRDELSVWFTVLSYKPGYSPHSQRPVITKPAFLPQSIPVLDASAYGSPSLPTKAMPRKCLDTKIVPVAHGTSRGTPKLPNVEPTAGLGVPGPELPNSSNQESVPNSNAESMHQHETPTTPLQDEIVPDKVVRNLKVGSAEASQDTTNCSEENLDGSSAHPSSPTPDNSMAQERVVHDEGSDSDFRSHDYELLDTNLDESSAEGSTDGRLSKAREAARRVARLMKEAGPKILKKQLVHDLRQSLREDLILDVPSISTLFFLAKRFRTSDFVTAADELCGRLEALDAHKCFTDGPDYGYGPPDLRSLREELEAGKIYTIAGIIRKFRLLCGDLMQFHQSSVMLNEAALIKHFGEETISNFISENYQLVKEEKRISRIASICQTAEKIGFRERERRSKTRRASSVKSPGKAKPAIRVSGYQSDVTFLNYRDEKGHSVMGKRHSARVFGISIDRRACESRIGNVRPCHICRRQVFLSDGDALRCTNHVLGVCEEMVCRKCLEIVFFVGEAEFVESRQADDWVCVHCRGLCHGGGICKVACISRSKPQAFLADLDVAFPWSYESTAANCVTVKFARRSMSGEFESWDSATSLNLAKDVAASLWSGRLRLCVGVYRCRVETDGVWTASTTVQVIPTATEGSGYNLRASESDVVKCTEHGHLAPSPVLNRSIQRRRIGWRVSSNPRHDSGSVHAICKTEGGTLVQRSCRTEGYDWRRSKRHTVSQWIPEQTNLGCQGQVTKAEGKHVLCLAASSQGHPGAFCHEGFPRLKTGMYYETFRKAVNAFRFDHMAENLWGIVAGKSDIHGIGLFTLTGYQKGDFVIEYAGELIRSPLADLRETRYEAARLGTYFFKIDELHIVDATVKSNRARFTNHSCDPNMAAQIVHVRGRDLVALLATRDIPPFSELTFNYQLPYEDKKLQCLCSSWNCAGVMN